jgi:hypothetical protein
VTWGHVNITLDANASIRRAYLAVTVVPIFALLTGVQ